MKLYYSSASPYARKVLVVAREAGILDQINVVNAAASPVDPNTEIGAANPVRKIPTLVLDDGRAIFDSRVISEFIDSMGSNSSLFPTDMNARISTLTIQALGDAMLDAALLSRYETAMRPPEFLWEDWNNGQLAKINSSLDFLENNCLDKLNGPINIGNITIACALGYIEFRDIVADWRNERDGLTKWYEAFRQRESMKATEPS